MPPQLNPQRVVAPANRPSSPSPAQKTWKFQAIKGPHFSEAAELFTGWDVACSSHKTKTACWRRTRALSGCCFPADWVDGGLGLGWGASVERRHRAKSPILPQSGGGARHRSADGGAVPYWAGLFFQFGRTATNADRAVCEDAGIHLERPAFPILGNGPGAVVLFFVLSGFVLTLVLQQGAERGVTKATFSFWPASAEFIQLSSRQ